MRVKLADANTPRDFEFHDRLHRHRAEVERRLRRGRRDATPTIDEATEYAFTVTFDYDGELKALADRVEDVNGAEVLSLGHALEIVKDLGDAATVAHDYGLGRVRRHARDRPRAGWRRSPTSTSRARTRTGRIRSPTSRSSTTASSRTTTSGAGAWSAAGHRFQSECDSEIIAVYLAEKMAEGALARGRDAPVARRARRRLHLHVRHRGRARDGQGRAGRQAARALRVRRPRRARLRGDRDPRASIDREIDDVRPLRGGGDGVDIA